jgi:membrane fusion protein (multidrug efflux system)
VPIHPAARNSILLVASIALVTLGGLGVARAEEPAALVATRLIEPGPYRISLPEKLGRLEAGRDRTLSFEVSGRIATVVREGEAVEAGDTIASLDTGLETARLRQAELRLREARSELTRDRGLRKANAISARGLESRETALGIAEAEFDAAREQLARRHLVAPFAGIVVQTLQDPDEVVSPALPVARFMELDPLKLQVGVPEHQIDEVSEGALVLLDLRSLPDAGITGEVSRVARAVVQGRHLFEVEVQIQNSDGRLRPGVGVRARIVTRNLEQAVAVPASVTVKRGGKRVVFFADGGVAQKIDVEDSILQGDQLVITQPMPLRELVIRGQRKLYEGMAVEVDNRVLGEPGRGG